MKSFAAALLCATAFAALSTSAMAGITKTAWGETPGHQKVELYTLTSGKLTARIATYGAVIVSLDVPDKDGKTADIVRGFDTLEGYVDPKFGNGYYGAVVGRYANRIRGAKFTLDGKEYRLPAGNGGNILHGGPLGFDKRVWTTRARDGASPSLILSYTSLDGEQNFPGTMKVTVTYTLKPTGLTADYAATTDKPTVVNLTNHSYFNLKGAGNGDALGHKLQINADNITVADNTATAMGDIRAVAGGPFDFRAGKLLGTDIRNTTDDQIARPRGYDQNFVLNGKAGTLRLAARVEEPASGRVMEVLTTQPGVQLFTANGPRTVTGKRGEQYVQYGAICLETQHYANSPNIPGFPSTVLRPGERFHEVTEYRFSVLK